MKTWEDFIDDYATEDERMEIDHWLQYIENLGKSELVDSIKFETLPAPPKIVSRLKEMANEANVEERLLKIKEGWDF